jgi:hypothetical protein
MNKVDLELEEFMNSSEKGCHKFKQDIIKWSFYTKVRIHWHGLLKRVEQYLEGKTRDSQNLICEYHRHGVESPLQITMDELKTDFFCVQKEYRAPYEK